MAAGPNRDEFGHKLRSRRWEPRQANATEQFGRDLDIGQAIEKFRVCFKNGRVDVFYRRHKLRKPDRLVRIAQFFRDVTCVFKFDAEDVPGFLSGASVVLAHTSISKQFKSAAGLLNKCERALVEKVSSRPARNRQGLAAAMRTRVAIRPARAAGD